MQKGIKFRIYPNTAGSAPLDVIRQYIENQKTSQRQKDKQG